MEENRIKGVANFAVNFEPGGQSPLDARLLVPTKASLINPSTYEAKNYYKGMMVVIQDTQEVYILNDPDKITSSDYAGWTNIGKSVEEQVPCNIVNKYSGLPLGIRGHSWGPAVVEQQDFGNYLDQQWKLIYKGDTVAIINGVYDNLCLYPRYNSADENSVLATDWYNENNPFHHWEVIPVAVDGILYHRFMNVGSKLTLTVETHGGTGQTSTVAGAVIRQFKYYGTASQLFTLNEDIITSSPKTISLTLSEGNVRYIGIDSGYPLTDLALLTSHINIDDSCKWRVIYNDEEESTFKLRNVQSSMYACIHNDSLDAGAGVIQTSDRESVSTNWEWVSGSDGTTYLRNINSSLVLGIDGGNSADNAVIIQWTLQENDPNQLITGINSSTEIVNAGNETSFNYPMYHRGTLSATSLFLVESVSYGDVYTIVDDFTFSDTSYEAGTMMMCISPITKRSENTEDKWRVLGPATRTIDTNTLKNEIIAEITDSAPETLDTLNELAAALGDDPNFATTVTNKLSQKVETVNASGTPPLVLSASKSGTTVNLIGKLDYLSNGVTYYNIPNVESGLSGAKQFAFTSSLTEQRRFSIAFVHPLKVLSAPSSDNYGVVRVGIEKEELIKYGSIAGGGTKSFRLLSNYYREGQGANITNYSISFDIYYHKTYSKIIIAGSTWDHNEYHLYYTGNFAFINNLKVYINATGASLFLKDVPCNSNIPKIAITNWVCTGNTRVSIAMGGGFVSVSYVPTFTEVESPTSPLHIIDAKPLVEDEEGIIIT